MVTLSHGGYMKSQPVAEYRAPARGGRGKQATATKEDDFIDRLFIANTHDYILCFSNRGRVYWLKVYKVPQGCRVSRGKPIVNMLPLHEHEKITAILPVKEFVDDRFVFMATAHGHGQEDAAVRLLATAALGHHRGRSRRRRLPDRRGADRRPARRDAVLRPARQCVSRKTMCARWAAARAGCAACMLAKGQRVISMLVAEDEQQSVLTATENGYGKRTPIVEYTRHGRGTKGMIAIQRATATARSSPRRWCDPSDEVMLISTGGVLIRTGVEEIREMGRSTQGVTLINLGGGEKLAGLERVVETEDDNGDGA